VSAKLHTIQLWRAGTGTQGEREAANEESKHPRAPLKDERAVVRHRSRAFSVFSVQRAAFSVQRSACSVQRSAFANKEGTGFVAVFTDALLAMNTR
jgi:hypothetical protein